MTDQEMIDIVAEKVMGWWYDNGWWAGDQFPVKSFDPFHNDNDLMMAWDRLAEVTSVKLASKRKGNNLIWQAYCPSMLFAFSYNTDRRRAMMLCMVKAVTE